MSNQPLRDLVTSRLTAAAEEIFVLFDKTIMKYEEELSRSRQENLEKQQLLDSILNPRIKLVSVSTHSPSLYPPGPGLTDVCTETLHIKTEPEEQSIKQEEELPSPESTAVCVKSEESSPIQQQTEHQDKTGNENISSVPECEEQTESSSDTDDDEDWACPLNSAESSETEVDGGHCEQVQKRRKKSASKTGALENNVVTGGAKPKKPQGEPGSKDEGTDKKNQCPVCKIKCRSEKDLQIHSRVHTGESGFSCSICMKTFTRKSYLNDHKRTHTGEKPFSCSICSKTFSLKNSLTRHIRIHANLKPFSCTVCDRTFSQNTHLNLHMRTHTGEKPFSCTVCKKTFSLKCSLDIHTRVHTKEKPYSCPMCSKSFSQRSSLMVHKRIHTNEKPYTCTVCNLSYRQKTTLDKHMMIHTGERPFYCTVCNKTFSLKNHLETHKKLHTGENHSVEQFARKYLSGGCDR